ncbi:cytochrome P450 [Ophiobolus disseminans]|uniref:Cytochrome P450 n=1 Tax=Ophiobolus disseminans TaxID=1469910 RepID=A0A6A7A5Q8_9PLEO|nr:cytochrome P450 [Ophiobolus disseminans]
MALPLYTLLTALVAVVVYQLSKIGRRPKGYPPGPPTLPLIGNLHLMPKEKPHLQFKKWAEEYGPVYSLILGTKVMIVLSSDKAVKDLLDRRSGIYSSRPDMYLGRIASGGLRMLLMEYGEQWRMIRKIVHNNLNIRAARTYVPYQDLENKALLHGLLDEPHLFIDHIRRYTNSLTTQMIFGFRTTSIDDPKLKQLYHGFDKFSQLMGSEGAALLDLFPILRALPDFMLPLRRYAKKLHEKESELYVGHWLNVKKAIKNGTAKPCFCLDLVRAQDEQGFSDPLAGYVSGSLLEAGSDTTSATLIGFVQAMVLFPEVAKAGQEELDRVCGDRMPTLEDVPELPFIRGCVKESLRWMPTDIVGVPHAVIRDDEYEGYTIPKGAGVMWNVWAIHNDPQRHPDPRRFDPMRYADDDQTAAEAANNADASQRDHFVFGAGRRLCQGMHIAERSLFLAISRLLWAFDLRTARNEYGVEVVPDAEDLTEGLLIQPKPFPASIVPRSDDKAEKVREEWEKMEELLDEEMQWNVLPEGLIWKEYKKAAEVDLEEV